ncbi:putative lip/Mn/Versatile peroxidase [Podospora fimiseda]|uniref:Peroxidase n=1 Tax=Podospora fimiseda TaxID=252190 RepID=A0AAN7BK51_9PEZI|nr:putative lip/Mn/Versatile peroxidase [Podospora fimiseda]
MKLSSVVAASAMFSAVNAYPGMNASLIETLKEADCCGSNELIGDLLWLDNSRLSPVALLIKSILIYDTDARSDEFYYQVPALRSFACVRDPCCVWWYIVEEMEKLFRAPDGQCTNAARAAIRLGFHDAGAWSKHTGDFGGADGSIVWAPEEIKRRENHGLEEIIQQMKHWYGKWNSYGISVADLIQMAATTATVVCPLGPRIRSFVGRRDSHRPAPDGLIPSPFDPAEKLIELFRAKTIKPSGLAALLGAHSTSKQRFLDAASFGFPQDSTPGVWDILFYEQTLGVGAPDIFRFPSDIILSQHAHLYPAFRTFTGVNGQERWNYDYAREYVRLSLLGVNNVNNLTDCTRVLPQARTEWKYE